MTKKCRKIKFSTRKKAEKQAKFLTEEYGSPMIAYKCQKLSCSAYHVANADSRYTSYLFNYLPKTKNQPDHTQPPCGA